MKKLLLVLLIISSIIISCIYVIVSYKEYKYPPSLNKAQTYFQKHYDDICIIKDFLMEEDGSFRLDCYRYSTQIWFQKTAPNEIISCVKHLRRASGQSRLFIEKNNNTITITFWIPTGRDICSGFAYSIDSTVLPDIPYATSIIPLGESGWYYYIDDFSTWLANQKTGDGFAS